MASGSQSAARPRVACLTMVKDDGVFLDIWCRYYAGLFGAAQCHVVDHGSTETAALDRARAMGVQVLRVPFEYPASAPQGIRPDGQPAQFDGYRFAFLSRLRAALRVFYDIVILHDADEVMVVHPDRGGDLAAYVAAAPDHAVLGGLGVEVFHDPATEPAFDPDLPVLAQRRHAHFRLPECKPVLFRSNVAATPHGTAEPFAIDPDLWLIHLKFLDRDLMRARQSHRLAVVGKGEVPDWTRWGWSLEEVDAQLAGFARRPLDPDDQRGRRFLAARFRAGNGGCSMVERAKARSPGQYEPDAGLSVEVQAALHDARFHLPQFQGVDL